MHSGDVLEVSAVGIATVTPGAIDIVSRTPAITNNQEIHCYAIYLQCNDRMNMIDRSEAPAMGRAYFESGRGDSLLAHVRKRRKCRRRRIYAPGMCSATGDSFL